MRMSVTAKIAISDLEAHSQSRTQCDLGDLDTHQIQFIPFVNSPVLLFSFLLCCVVSFGGAKCNLKQNPFLTFILPISSSW